MWGLPARITVPGSRSIDSSTSCLFIWARERAITTWYMTDPVTSPPKKRHLARSEHSPTTPPSGDRSEETLIAPSAEASAVRPAANIPVGTWASLGDVGDSDLPSAPTGDPGLPPEGDFGFTGTFMSDDIVLGGSLEVRRNKVTLWTGGTQLASWSASDCRVTRLTGSEFSIEADAEMITFTADDAESLGAAISAFLQAEPTPIEVPKPAPHLSRAAATVHKPPATPTPEPLVEKVPQLEPERPSITEPSPGIGEAPRSKNFPTFRRARVKDFKEPSAEQRVLLPSPPGEPVDTEAEAPILDDQDDRDVSAISALGQEDGGTIGDKISANAKRRYRAAKANRWQKADLEKVAIKAGVIGAVIGILTLFALTVYILTGGLRGAEPEFAPAPPTTTIPPAPTSTVVVTTTLPEPTMLFDAGTAELTERWNELAEQSRPELAIFSLLTSPFLLSLAPHITLEGLLDPQTGSLLLRATPTGTPEGDGQVLTALGLLIGTADPSLDGSDRRALLESLGLRIQDPQLSGLDGTVTHNGLTYRLAFLVEQGVLEFRISPENAAADTTATTAATTTTAP